MIQRPLRIGTFVTALAGVLLLAAGAFAAPAATAAPGTGPEWLCFRGPDRQNKSPDTGLLKEWPQAGPPLAWKVTDIGKGFSAITASGGLLYITGDVGKTLTLFALDLDGKPKWKQEFGPDATNVPGARGSVTLDGGNAYLLSGTGKLGCFDAKTGTPKWTKDAKEFGGGSGGWGYAESPLIYQDMVIFKPGGKSCIVALNKATGQPVWASQGVNAGPEYSSCLAFTHAGVPVIATGTSKGVFGVSPKDGSLLFSNSFSAGNTANCPTPVYSDGYVFWANGYGKGGVCLQFNPAGKAVEAWTTGDMVNHHGGYLVDNGYLYGHSDSGNWTCLELKTGKKMWQAQGVGKGSIAWADGMLYLFSESAGQAALATCSPQGLQIKGKVKVEGENVKNPSWAHPVVIGGKLYLRYDTNLYCFDVKAK